MSYIKTEWKNNETKLNQDNLNHIEDGIAEAFEVIEEKQDKLVSGQNIKTINNQSLLGEGNINISGGSGAVISVNNQEPDEDGDVEIDANDIKLDKTETTSTTIFDNMILHTDGLEVYGNIPTILKISESEIDELFQ